MLLLNPLCSFTKWVCDSITIDNNLKQFKTDDGLELLIDLQTGEVFVR
jgi:hypothetical protein